MIPQPLSLRSGKRTGAPGARHSPRKPRRGHPQLALRCSRGPSAPRSPHDRRLQSHPPALQGHSTEELPERLLGSVRLNHLDLKAARELDTSVEIASVPRQVPAGFDVDGDPRRCTATPSSSGA